MQPKRSTIKSESQIRRLLQSDIFVIIASFACFACFACFDSFVCFLHLCSLAPSSLPFVIIASFPHPRLFPVILVPLLHHHLIPSSSLPSSSSYSSIIFSSFRHPRESGDPKLTVLNKLWSSPEDLCHRPV